MSSKPDIIQSPPKGLTFDVFGTTVSDFDPAVIRHGTAHSAARIQGLMQIDLHIP